jgi:hypothetical protein
MEILDEAIQQVTLCSVCFTLFSLIRGSGTPSIKVKKRNPIDKHIMTIHQACSLPDPLSTMQ